MFQINGVVQDKPVNNTAKGNFHGLTVNGTKYDVGKYPAKCNVGDTVSFVATQNGQYWRMDYKTLQVLQQGSGGGHQQQYQPQQQGQASPPQQAQGKPPLDAKQTIIEWQSSRNTAAMIYQAAGSCGALDGLSLDQIIDGVFALTGELYIQSLTEPKRVREQFKANRGQAQQPAQQQYQAPAQQQPVQQQPQQQYQQAPTDFDEDIPF